MNQVYVGLCVFVSLNFPKALQTHKCKIAAAHFIGFGCEKHGTCFKNMQVCIVSAKSISSIS